MARKTWHDLTIMNERYELTEKGQRMQDAKSTIIPVQPIGEKDMTQEHTDLSQVPQRLMLVVDNNKDSELHHYRGEWFAVYGDENKAITFINGIQITFKPRPNRYNSTHAVKNFIDNHLDTGGIHIG